MPTASLNHTAIAHLESTFVPLTSGYYRHFSNSHSLTATADKASDHHIPCDTSTDKFTHNGLVLSYDNFTSRLLPTRSLTSPSELSGDEMTTTETLPDSPPDLSSSKSSTKSSSCQSSHNDDFNDISNFEDISLTEGRPPMRNLTSRRPELKPQPLPRTARLSASPPHHTSPPLGENESRTAATLNGHARGINKTHSPRNSWQRGYHPRSSPTLNVPVNTGRRTPSPIPQLFPTSPRSTSSVSYPWLDQSPNLAPSRRGSWTRRKTAEELEREYDDFDEDVPEDAIIWNVPLSPRPSQERSQSVSPERELPAIRTSGIRPPVTPRSMSWTAALSELSDDARCLTEALETHADSTQWPKQDENHKPISSANSSLRPSPHRAKTVPLPPIQRGDVMVDPLPISIEKEKVLARTRPSWLPPKCRKEERRHVKEYQHMMNNYLASQKRKSELVKKADTTREKEALSMTRLWEETVLPDWDTAIKAPKTRELWWRGIPPQLRGLVWAKAVGNDLHLNSASYEAALARAKSLLHSNRPHGQLHSSSQTELVNLPTQTGQDNHQNQAHHTRQRSESNPIPLHKIHHSLTLIHNDIPSVFPTLHLFQPHQPSHLPLLDLLTAYSSYRSDTGYTRGTAAIAALLLLHLPTPSSAFILFANLLNRPTSLAFCLGDEAGAKAKCITHILRALNYKLPRLAEHLSAVPGLRAGEWLDPMCMSLFTNVLSREEVERVFDVLVFEGDVVVVRVAVAVVARWEGRLYGGKEEVLRVLGCGAERGGMVGTTRDWTVGVTKDQATGIEEGQSAEAMMRRVRWAGREDVDTK